MVADYWVVRKTELDVNDLFRRNGRYGAWNGVGLASLALGLLCAASGKLLMWGTGDASWNNLFSYAWFLGFGVSFAAYAAIAKRPTPVAA
jgi:NCS1 family nucleobase:cation symporter-1